MLVIRPSNKVRQKPLAPITTRKPTASTANLPNLSENTVSDLDTASSISTGMNVTRIFFYYCLNWKRKYLLFGILGIGSLGLWNANAHTTQWQVTTQPNFITKPKPTYSWEKPLRPKPKPTKKPHPSNGNVIVKRPPAISSASSTASQATQTTTKPKPPEVSRSFIFFAIPHPTQHCVRKNITSFFWI